MRGGKRPGAGRPRGVVAGTKGKRLEEHLGDRFRLSCDSPENTSVEKNPRGVFINIGKD